MTPTPKPRYLPPRRLLAIAASLALVNGQAEAKSSSNQHPKASLDGSQMVCPLGSLHCPPRPDNFALCRPNAMLEFYDPFLSKDNTVRDTAKTYGWAEHVDSSDQTVYHLSGNVKMTRADQQMQSDRADYNNDTSDYDASGNVRYQDYGQLMAATHMRGNNDDSTGIADNVRYQMLDSRGNGVAKQGQMFDAQHSRYFQATYSTCDIGHHIWEFRAKNIAIDKDSGVGTAHDGTFRFYNVPFFYLPIFTFPVDNRRKSGFLYPTFSDTSRSGFMLSTPYYLNLAPNYDATLDPRLYVERGLMLGGEFRYLNLEHSTGIMDVQFLPDDRANDQIKYGDPNAFDSQGKDRYMIKWVNNTSLWPGWSLNSNINHASDANFLRDFGNDLYSASTGTLTSSAYLNGGGSWWNTSFGADEYQNVDPALPNSVAPYKRWPRATLNLDIPLNRWLEFGMNNEAVAFRKAGVVEGNRLDLYPYLAADFEGPAWFIRPKLAYRYTAYELSGGYQSYGFSGPLALTPGYTTPFTDRTPSRAMPIVSIDNGLVFERNTSLFNTDYTQTLEPRLYYLYVPYRNQNNLPLFDTGLNSFDAWELFSPNQYSGADRQMNANNLSAAVTSRLLDDGGVERLAVTFGQIRYFTAQRVQLPNGQNTISPVTNYSGSDYVVQLNSQLSDDWRLNGTYQWNPNSRKNDVGEVELQRRLGIDGVLNFSYRYRLNPMQLGTNGQLVPLMKQYDASVVYPVSDRWRLVGHWTYSVVDKRTVEALAGVQYESCCVKVSLIGRHYVEGYSSIVLTPGTTPSSTNNAVMLVFEFKGIGAFNGQDENLLRNGILGYQ